MLRHPIQLLLARFTAAPTAAALPLRGLGLTLIALLALHGIDKEFCLEGLVLSAERSAT